jgi:hypothetical protein
LINNKDLYPDTAPGGQLISDPPYPDPQDCQLYLIQNSAARFHCGGGCWILNPEPENSPENNLENNPENPELPSV